MPLALTAEVLLVALQVIAVLLILGVPNLSAAVAVVGTGFVSAQNTVALIAALLWAGTIVLALTVLVHGVRSVQRRTHSSLLPLLAVMVGLCCLGAGIVHQESASFHPCCGSLARAQSLLEPGR